MLSTLVSDRSLMHVLCLGLTRRCLPCDEVNVYSLHVRDRLTTLNVGNKPKRKEVTSSRVRRKKTDLSKVERHSVTGICYRRKELRIVRRLCTCQRINVPDAEQCFRSTDDVQPRFGSRGTPLARYRRDKR